MNGFTYFATTILTLFVVMVAATPSVILAQLSPEEDPYANDVPVINSGILAESDVDKVAFEISGIDYSINIAQVLITVNGKTYSQAFSPVSLLDPHDDEDDDIRFALALPTGAIKLGDKYTSCIKVLDHTDEFGNLLACKNGVINEIQALTDAPPQISLDL